VQNTYDADPVGVSWTGSNVAVGQLTQRIATTYLPGPDYAQGKVTENKQYDQRGRLLTQRLQIQVTGGSLPFPTLPLYEQTSAYNNANQPTTTQTTNGGQPGFTSTQVYDSTTGVLTGLSSNTTAAANLATLSYNAMGLPGAVNLLTTTGTALATTSLLYDGNLRLSGSQSTWQSGSGTTGTIFSEGLAYDPAGNVIRRVTTHAAIPGVNNSGGSEAQNFCYDEHNRLLWAGNSGTQPAAGNGTCGSGSLTSDPNLGSYSASYAYTHLGQLWQGPLNGTGSQKQYLYCDSNKPHQLNYLVTPGASCTSPGTTGWQGSYDAWGNLVSRQTGGVTGTLAFDGLDHLVRWQSTTGTQKEWYLYDGDGKRVLKRSFDGTSTKITISPFGQEEHEYQYPGSGSTMSVLEQRTYESLAGRLIAVRHGSTSLNTDLVLTDTLGSVLASMSSTAGSASLLGNQMFGPYGKQRYSKGTIPTTKGYTGQYGDALTGLDYYVARYYDAVVGRFLSADTVESNLEGMDPYAYVGGNPQTMNDPSGHWGWGHTLVAAVAIVAVTAAVAVVAAPILIGVGAAVGTAALVTYGAIGIVAAVTAIGATASIVGNAIGSESAGVEPEYRDVFLWGMLGGGAAGVGALLATLGTPMALIGGASAFIFAAMQQRSDTLKNQQEIKKAEATGFAKGKATGIAERQATAVTEQATAVAKAKATGIAQGQATATAQKKPVSTPAPQKALVVNQYQQVKQHFLTRRTASSPHQAQLERMRIKWYQLLFSEAHSWSW
jgi:RHS repeat-associated protein